jgi:hypothetical protein
MLKRFIRENALKHKKLFIALAIYDKTGKIEEGLKVFEDNR